MRKLKAVMPGDVHDTVPYLKQLETVHQKVIPFETEVLQGLAADLLSAVVEACDRCDNCQMDKPRELMAGPILQGER